MVNVAKAIELLAPFHSAVVFCKVKSETSNRFNGQLTTGNPNYPFIGINDSTVTSENLIEALEYHIASNPNTPINMDTIEYLNYSSSTLLTIV